MNNWHLKQKTTIIYKYMNVFPFKLLPLAKRLQKIEKSSVHVFDSESQKPKNDRLDIEICAISQLIPVELYQDFIGNIDRFIKKECETGFQLYQESQYVNGFFERLNVLPGDWINLGYYKLKNQEIFKSFQLSVVRISESLILPLMNYVYSDELKYQFNQIINAKYDSSVYISREKLRLRNGGIRIAYPEHILKDNLYKFYKTVRYLIINLLKRNKILYHIGAVESINISHIHTFVREVIPILDKKKHYPYFWDIFGYTGDNNFAYIDADDIYFFPDSINFREVTGKSNNIILVSIENMISKEFISDPINRILHDQPTFQHSIYRLLVLNNIIDRHYKTLTKFRMKNFLLFSKFWSVKRYFDFHEKTYWINVLVKEYQSEYYKKYGHIYKPKLSKNYFNKQNDLLDILESTFDSKLTSVKRALEVLSMKIEKEKDYSIIKTNTIIQLLLIVLTAITIITAL